MPSVDFPDHPRPTPERLRTLSEPPPANVGRGPTGGRRRAVGKRSGSGRERSGAVGKDVNDYIEDAVGKRSGSGRERSGAVGNDLDPSGGAGLKHTLPVIDFPPPSSGADLENGNMFGSLRGVVAKFLLRVHILWRSGRVVSKTMQIPKINARICRVIGV